MSSPDAVIKIEACRALGKVGRSEDATVLAGVMTLDNLEDARIAAIEGLAELKTSDARIYRMLVDAMEHEDPAIRLASLNALRKLTSTDQGTEVAAWRTYLKPMMEALRPRRQHQGRDGSPQGWRRDERSAGRPVRITALDHAALTPLLPGPLPIVDGRLARVAP